MLEDRNNARFNLALGDYARADAMFKGMSKVADLTDDEAVRRLDRRTNAAIALVQSGAKGPDAARRLLCIALERFRSEDEQSFRLEPEYNEGIDSRLDFAFLLAALAALSDDEPKATTMTDARLAAALDISEIGKLSDAALLARARELQQIDSDSGQLSPDEPGYDDAMRVQSDVIDCLDAIVKELVSRPMQTVAEAKTRAEAVMICCPCTFECPDPSEKIVADFVRGIAAMDLPADAPDAPTSYNRGV